MKELRRAVLGYRLRQRELCTRCTKQRAVHSPWLPPEVRVTDHEFTHDQKEG